MLPRNQPPDWDSLWAALLQGIGTGLLHYDGSPLAQAALKGLEAFDAAQERRRRSDSPALEFAPEQGPLDAETPQPEMSQAEIAAFLRLTPEEQAAYWAELAEAYARARQSGHDDRSDARQARLQAHLEGSGRNTPTRRAPLSASPFEGWPLETILPFARDGRVNVTALRR